MPTFDRAGLLPDAVQSVLEQTHTDWELLVCDDGSTDETREVIAGFGDDRIRLLALPHRGAAAARNAGLEQATGELTAYLDTDNVWHPRYLEIMVDALTGNPGRYCAYARYVDVEIKGAETNLRSCRSLPFDYERLRAKNYIDLNTFVHRRSVYQQLGGMTESLARQQDWDLILKYTFLRDPLYLDQLLVLYRRNKAWGQLTYDQKSETPRTSSIIADNVRRYHRDGLPAPSVAPADRKITILSWDVCRNHFSKAWNLAACLAEQHPVQLIGFRFFGPQVFEPLRGRQPNFDLILFDGDDLPGMNRHLAQALSAIDGDVIYCVKPRLTSLGLGLLANYHTGKPLVLEVNDLESVVTTPGSEALLPTLDLDKADLSDPKLLSPYSTLWSRILESLAPGLPTLVTHNQNLDAWLGHSAHFVRNLKDERIFDPERFDRRAVRRELGFTDEERILLFAGLVREHKGLFELTRFLEGAAKTRLVVAGARETPDLKRLRKEAGDRVRFLPPGDDEAMARLNLAADAVILWLDPQVPASRFQMPYKLTDAMAMGTPVIANPISDLKQLGEQEFLRLVPYGDLEGLQRTLDELGKDPSARESTTRAARELYLRQFSYRSVRRTLDLILEDLPADGKTLDAAAEFAGFFSRLYEQLRVG